MVFAEASSLWQSHFNCRLQGVWITVCIVFGYKGSIVNCFFLSQIFGLLLCHSPVLILKGLLLKPAMVYKVHRPIFCLQRVLSTNEGEKQSKCESITYNRFACKKMLILRIMYNNGTHLMHAHNMYTHRHKQKGGRSHSTALFE